MYWSNLVHIAYWDDVKNVCKNMWQKKEFPRCLKELPSRWCFSMGTKAKETETQRKEWFKCKIFENS
jgi:hypothetical protein